MFSKAREMADKMRNIFTMAKGEMYENEAELIDLVVKKEFKRRQTERMPFELQWRLNIDYNNGNQFRIINDQTKNIEDKPLLYWWEERKVYNQIAPIVETRLAKLARVPTDLKTRPATSESNDISSAKVSTKVLESTSKDQEMERLKQRANSWAEVCGTAIWKPTWNNKAGQKLAEVNETIMGEVEQTNSQTYYEGDIQTDVLPPFEIFPDSCFNDEEECRSIIHAKAYHKLDVKEIWGKDVDGEKVNVFTLNKSSGSGGIGVKGNGYSITASTKENSVVVYEYWELPTSKYPNGRLIICTEKVLLYAGDMPYALGEDGGYILPFFTQQCIIQNQCYWGKAIVERLIDLQTQYNALKNRKTEYLNRCAIGTITYEEGTVDEDMLEMDGLAPGQMIPHRQGSNPPRFMDNPALPSTFETEEQKVLNDFNRISGVSEISRDSQAPIGVGSGVALSILQEQDDTRLSLTAKHIQNTMLKLGKAWLRLFKEFVEIPRTLRSVGKNNFIEVLDWDSSNITSYDLYIETSSQLSETPAQRRQMVFDLLQAGLFMDPETGRLSKEGQMKVYEMLELGNWESFDDQENLHDQKALRENRTMLMGQMPQVRDFDDDITHIERHNSYRLTSDYEEQMADNPSVDQIFEQHIQMHFTNVQAKMPQQPPMMEGQEQQQLAPPQ